MGEAEGCVLRWGGFDAHNDFCCGAIGNWRTSVGSSLLTSFRLCGLATGAKQEPFHGIHFLQATNLIKSLVYIFTPNNNNH
jgi:hypothetical protein